MENEPRGGAEGPPLAIESESVAQPENGNVREPVNDPAPVVCPEIPREVPAIGTLNAETAETKMEIGEEGTGEFDLAKEAGGIVDTTTQNEPTAPPVDRRNRQNGPTAQEAAVISGPRLPFHRAVVSAIMLVVLFGAAVRSHRNSQNEPTAVTIDHRNRQNEPIAAPGRATGVEVVPGARQEPRDRPRRYRRITPTFHPARTSSLRAGMAGPSPRQCTHLGSLDEPRTSRTPFAEVILALPAASL